MKAQIVEQVEFFSEAELESLGFVPEELEAIETERVPDLDSIAFEDIAKDLEAYFEGNIEQAGLEGRGRSPSRSPSPSRSRGLSPSRSQGRTGAVDATRNYQAGTVGAVVHRAVTPFAKVFGDFASGNIGSHYQEPNTVRLLSLPDNDKNLRDFAQDETRWWKEQSGFAGTVGSAMTAEQRTNLLRCVKDNPRNPSSCSIM
ncbi:hypothetical protein PQG02_35900 (plasmid) [Nostoc sp. UHCC 0926]|uniref:hypothetical protein n=1 Tax=Nostoc sp. UHCC 0926 TaxID=3025190 RepID=UPI002360F8A9|nr:hypothetical protein [Nostoc sp. UHCC 0926]WDD36527.1 hypothetical protein PQG02_35900 [Nostoc sp. UHCC 0926]